MARRSESKARRPWDQEGSSERIMFGVRIPRRVVLQLDYLAGSEERSRQWVFERQVAPLIEHLAEDLWTRKGKEVAEPTGVSTSASLRAARNRAARRPG
jgi:hypothetical protein